MPLNLDANFVLRYEEGIMLLYKYLSDVKYALDVLKTNEIKLSSYADFNDPFDGSFCFSGKITSEFVANDFADAFEYKPFSSL